MELTPSPGVQKKFSALYLKHAQSIFRFCHFHLHDRAVAEELMQETFFKTWEYVAKGNSIEHVRAFLFRTARNLIINHSQRKKAASLEELQESGFDPGQDDPKHKRDFVAEHRVLTVLHKLDEPYRQTIILSYIEGLSPSEIAEVIGVTSNVVSVRLNRGLKRLKSLLSLHGSRA